MTATRPTWAEISQGRLRRNFRRLRDLAGADSELLAVVKANAYGHGLELCARVLAGDGARWFGVTSVEEAVALRAVCPEARILAFSGVWPGEAEMVIDHAITPVIWEPSHFFLLEEAARKRGLGAGGVPVHLEVDTGMSRQGVQLHHLERLLSRFGSGAALRLEALMTHFHTPDESAPTELQVNELAKAVEAVARSGLRPDFLSAGSSADVLSQSTRMVTAMAEQHGMRRMVRTGLALYGYATQRGTGTELEPVLTWKARVTSVREIAKGSTAGYGHTFTAPATTRLALLPVGYADGFNRLLSNKGWALVRGQKAPVAGRVSMDQVMIDVTGIAGVAERDVVVLIGSDVAERVTADDLAEWTGTIPYEVLCAIAPRVPRVLVA